MTRLNVGNVDRLLRMLLGIVLIALAGGGFIGAWGYLGVVPLLTGISAFCPLYSLLGISSTSR
jgi:Inner membrane protein YgaP-like, transmembrane domain